MIGAPSPWVCLVLPCLKFLTVLVFSSSYNTFSFQQTSKLNRAAMAGSLMGRSATSCSLHKASLPILPHDMSNFQMDKQIK